MATLTGELSMRGTPAREWMEEHFPFADPSVIGWPRAVGGCAVPPPKVASHLLGRVGHAFDYRVRLALAPLEASELAALAGWKRIVAREVLSSASTQRQRTAATKRADRWAREQVEQGRDPVSRICAESNHFSGGSGATPSKDGQHRIAEACLLLAAYEEMCRAPLDLEHPTVRAGATPDLASLRAEVADQVLADDITELWEANADLTAGFLESERIITNPNFSDTFTVAADGDFIADETLVEVKTSGKPQHRRETVYQLLGYVLLGGDRFGMQRVGLWRPRHTRYDDFDIAELVVALSNGHHSDLPSLRASFKDAVAAMYSPLRGQRYRGLNGQAGRERTRSIRARMLRPPASSLPNVRIQGADSPPSMRRQDEH